MHDLETKLADHQADLAIILGSGLNGVVDAFDIHTTIPYAELPGFYTNHIAGHQGQLALGTYGKLRIACFQGRCHWYQGAEGKHFLAMMHAIKALKCPKLLITNAAGSLTEQMPVGTVAAIADHINCQARSPLHGLNPTPFIGMEDAYDPKWLEDIHTLSQQDTHAIPTAVYAGVLGPQFETPAEIGMLRTLGADLVGMSTVPDVIAARYAGIKVAALSLVTNMAAGMRQQTLSHDITLAGAKAGGECMIQWVHRICQQLSEHSE